MVRLGRFREDLLYRLNVVKVEVPPLRRRMEDIPLLCEHFLKVHAKPALRPTLSDEVRKRLLTHRWPGNVRELKNVIQNALCLMGSAELLPEHIVFTNNEAPMPPVAESFLADALSLEQVEVLTLRAALQRNAGNRTKAAEELQISRSTLKAKIAKHGLEREGLGDEEEDDDSE
jgi:transcriptional regulator with PAS, ATPase and Fis domain